MVWSVWQISVVLAKRAGCGILVTDDYTGSLRVNCHRLAVRLGKPDYGQWYLLLPTRARLRGRIKYVSLLGVGVCVDCREKFASNGMTQRRSPPIFLTRPRFDNRQYVDRLIQSINMHRLAQRIKEGPANYG